MAEVQADDLIGQTVGGRYEIASELGRGGMGAVYRAVHTGSGRRVALKLILKGAHDPKLRARFQREARAAGQIESKHVAQVLDVGLDESRDLPFIAMEFLEGEDLGALLKRVGPLPSKLVAKIGAQVAAGLAKAHAQGIVHRDIKPANIFLSRQDDEVVVKVLDFGVAKLVDPKLDGEIERLTSTGTLLGSPLYMSPEQALGEKEIDERADLWSLGIVLYELLSGVTPFEGCTAMGALFIAICSKRPPPVLDAAPWVAPELSTLVERVLQTAPADRLTPATELGAALRALTPEGTHLTIAELVGDPAAAAHFATRAAGPSHATPHPASQSGQPAQSGADARGRTTAAVVSSSRVPAAPSSPKPGARWVGVLGLGAVVAIGGTAAYALRSDGPTHAAASVASGAASASATAETSTAGAKVAPADTVTTASVASTTASATSTATPSANVGPAKTSLGAVHPATATPSAIATPSATAAPSASGRKNRGF